MLVKMLTTAAGPTLTGAIKDAVLDLDEEMARALIAAHAAVEVLPPPLVSEVPPFKVRKPDGTLINFANEAAWLAVADHFGPDGYRPATPEEVASPPPLVSEVPPSVSPRSGEALFTTPPRESPIGGSEPVKRAPGRPRKEG